MTYPFKKWTTPLENADFDRFRLIVPQPWEIARIIQLSLIGSRPRAFQRAIDEPCTLRISPPKGGTKREFLHLALPFISSLQVIVAIVPNFAKIGQNVPEIWPIFDFPRWRPFAISDLFYACWDHPQRVFLGLCDCAKFGRNRCSNFDSMQILIFCTLSLKMLIHAPKLGVFGAFYPQNGEQCERAHPWADIVST